MYTRPINLTQHLRTPSRALDAVPFLDLCLIGMFFGLASSRFIFAPGEAISLDSFALPEVPAERISGTPTTTVLTVMANDLLLFEGERLTFVQLPDKLADYVSEEDADDGTLLVKVDKNVDAQSLLTIFATARQAGFGQVQLAAVVKSPPPGQAPPTTTDPW